MAKRKIVWSARSQKRLYEILDFNIERNKSNSYSNKLYKLLQKETKILLKYPFLGLKTTEDSVRGLIIDEYIIYYEVTEDKIIIHTIWDCRQNPESNIII
jgi:plasmid stabilization system protein ParE